MEGPRAEGGGWREDRELVEKGEGEVETREEGERGERGKREEELEMIRNAMLLGCGFAWWFYDLRLLLPYRLDPWEEREEERGGGGGGGLFHLLEERERELREGGGGGGGW